MPESGKMPIRLVFVPELVEKERMDDSLEMAILSHPKDWVSDALATLRDPPPPVAGQKGKKVC